MKNFKRIMSMLIAFVLVLGTATVVSADREFSDLSTSHWAYANIQTLVNDGTINGYQDGSFRPDANVTRAEFVKMIGKTDIAFETSFDDIVGHWAYDYIMYSNMDVEGTSFRPDVPITRDDVIRLLWKRAGSPEAYAPGIITSQSAKPEAAAWAYSYGIMNGDDGITMRLSDGVTRAEAAALICRSRTIDTSSVKDFSSTIDSRLLKNVYEGMTFMGEYDPDRTYTYGELAGYAMQLMYEDSLPMFDGANFTYKVERPNSFAFSAACYHVWGEDKHTEAVYDSAVTNLDALAVLTFAANNKMYNKIVDGTTNDFYADVKSIQNDETNVLISAAHKKGIRLDNTDNIYPEKVFTGKSFALVLTQLDMIGGFNSAVATSYDISIPIDTAIRSVVSTYPANSDKFNFIMKDVPNEVYNTPFFDVDGSVATSSTKDMFRFARDNRDLFISYIQAMQFKWLELGAYTSVTFYPSLVCETDKGYVMKVRINVSAYDGTKSFDEIFPNISSDKKPDFAEDSTFYATLATGSKFSGITIPEGKSVITSIDFIE